MLAVNPSQSSCHVISPEKGYGGFPIFMTRPYIVRIGDLPYYNMKCKFKFKISLYFFMWSSVHLLKRCAKAIRIHYPIKSRMLSDDGLWSRAVLLAMQFYNEVRHW